MKKLLLVVAAVVASFCSTASAQITVELGTHDLLPDTAGQSIDILLSRMGLEQINGANGAFQITGTGILPSFNLISNASNNGPIVSGAAFTGTGFVFDGVSITTDETAPGIFPPAQSALFLVGATDFTEQVDAVGTLVSLEVDTTGVFSGEFDLIELTGDTVYFDASGSELARTPSVNGLINITAVPEPSALLLLAGLSAITCCRRRKSVC